MRASIVVSVIAGLLLAASMTLIHDSRSAPLLSWLTNRPGSSVEPAALEAHAGNINERTLPVGTVIRGLLQAPVGTRVSQSGDLVTLSVTEAVVLDGAISIPRGASILGQVSEVRAASGPASGGFLTLTFKSVTDSGGRPHRLKARPLRTSDLLPPDGSPPGDIELQRGDVLDIRLEAPLTVPVGTSRNAG